MFTASERPVTSPTPTFSENSAGMPGLDGHDAGGGGVYTEGGPFEISGATFSATPPTDDGGGLASTTTAT